MWHQYIMPFPAKFHQPIQDRYFSLAISSTFCMCLVDLEYLGFVVTCLGIYSCLLWLFHQLIIGWAIKHQTSCLCMWLKRNNDGIYEIAILLRPCSSVFTRQFWSIVVRLCSFWNLTSLNVLELFNIVMTYCHLVLLV